MGSLRLPYHSHVLTSIRIPTHPLQLESIIPHLADPAHPFAQCFEIHTRLDLHTSTDTVGDMINDLEQRVFSIGLTSQGRSEGKAWIWGGSMKGMVAYHLRGE